MKTSEWLSNIIENGALCGNYTDKVNEAKSKLQLFRLCCDANGANFLMEMQEKGMPLPYETITKELTVVLNKHVALSIVDKEAEITENIATTPPTTWYIP
jgi:hypothetical protein